MSIIAERVALVSSELPLATRKYKHGDHAEFAHSQAATVCDSQTTAITR